MKKIIRVNLPANIVIDKLNKIVRTSFKIKDQLGLTDYLFYGSKIEKDEFLWDSVKHINNLYRVKGKIVAVENNKTQINIEVINRPSRYMIYVLGIWLLIIGIITKNIFFVIFSVVFVIYSYIIKQSFLNKVTTDIKKIFT